MSTTEFDTTSAAAPTAGPIAAGTVTVASFATYAEAEAAVDRLSDSGFPVGGVAIVGRGVSTVEVVTGRMTTGRAALAGLGGGLWTGLFVGLLLGLFVPGIAWLSVVATSLVIGAVFGAVLGAVGHAMTGGRRDFASASTLRAERYDVEVDATVAEEARRLVAGGRPAGA